MAKSTYNDYIIFIYRTKIYICVSKQLKFTIEVNKIMFIIKKNR